MSGNGSFTFKVCFMFKPEFNKKFTGTQGRISLCAGSRPLRHPAGLKVADFHFLWYRICL
jgi:hypothetical protein